MVHFYADIAFCAAGLHSFKGMCKTGTLKFGALIGDGCRIGANAVLAPGTILETDTVIPRLALVDQWEER